MSLLIDYMKESILHLFGVASVRLVLNESTFLPWTVVSFVTTVSYFDGYSQFGIWIYRNSEPLCLNYMQMESRFRVEFLSTYLFASFAACERLMYRESKQKYVTRLDVISFKNIIIRRTLSLGSITMMRVVHATMTRVRIYPQETYGGVSWSVTVSGCESTDIEEISVTEMRKAIDKAIERS